MPFALVRSGESSDLPLPPHLPFFEAVDARDLGMIQRSECLRFTLEDAEARAGSECQR